MLHVYGVTHSGNLLCEFCRWVVLRVYSVHPFRQLAVSFVGGWCLCVHSGNLLVGGWCCVFDVQVVLCVWCSPVLRLVCRRVVFCVCILATCCTSFVGGWCCSYVCLMFAEFCRRVVLCFSICPFPVRVL